MKPELDEIDRRILGEWQLDATLSVDQMSERVNLSRNACWRRMRRLDDEGVVTGRVTLVDAEKLGLGLQDIEKLCDRLLKIVKEYAGLFAASDGTQRDVLVAGECAFCGWGVGHVT